MRKRQTYTHTVCTYIYTGGACRGLCCAFSVHVSVFCVHEIFCCFLFWIGVQDSFRFFGSLPPPPTSRMGLFCNGTHFYIAHLQSVLCCNATNCSILTKNAKHQGERVHAKEGGEKVGGALRGWVGVRDEWESEKASKRAKVPRGDVETGVIIPAFEPWTHSFLFF